MKAHILYQFALLTGLIIAPNFALAQSCGEIAYKDVSDCQTVYQSVKSATNGAGATTSTLVSGNGIAVPAQQTNTLGNWAAGSWTQVQQYCGKKLKECKDNCSDAADAKYLDACNNQINSIIAAAGQAGASNRTIASAAGAINGDTATVQQVGWNPSDSIRRLAIGASLVVVGQAPPAVGNPLPLMPSGSSWSSCASPPCN